MRLKDAFLYIFKNYFSPDSYILKVLGLFFLLTTVSIPLFSQQTQSQSPAGTNYLIYLPPNYDPIQDDSPLLVTLMGGGELGDDFSVFFKNNANRSPAWLINRNEWPADYPFVVLTPQLPRDSTISNNDHRWPTALVDEVLTHVINSYNVNENQIYLTGVSLGANGCWAYAAEFPQKVAAMVPMSGPADVATACQMKDIPIWAMHGGRDNLVEPIINSTGEMVDSINNCNGQYKARFDLIPSRSHDIWNDVYTQTMGLSIFDWLLKFEKGVTHNTKPYVGVGPDLKLLMPDEFINIYGFAFDVDGSIASYAWEIISPLSAELQVIDNNNVRLFPNQEGVHKIKLTATDDSTASNSDTITIEFFNATPANLTSITGLMLQDGDTDLDLFPLATEDNIINLFSLGTEEINIKALEDGTSNSFTYAVNGYKNIRTDKRESAGLLLHTRRGTAEWNVRTGKLYH